LISLQHIQRQLSVNRLRMSVLLALHFGPVAPFRLCCRVVRVCSAM
jgi:hypothetical protein